MGSLRRAVLAFLGAACSGVEPPSAPAAPPRWPCPPEWVAHAQGGCGPAVVLCPGDGGAAPGACEGIDYTHPHPVGDGGTSFYRLPDGAVGGGWPEALPELAEVETGSLAPPEDFAPTAGIPSCPAPWRRLGDGTCEPVFPDTCEASQTYPTLGALPPDARVLHVRAGASEAAADGTETAPFPTINRALAGVSAETWVRVAPGTYRENIVLRGSVHLVGCRHRVTVEAGTMDLPTFLAGQPGGQAELVGLTIRGGNLGVRVHGGGRVLLRAVDLTHNQGAGAFVSAADDPARRGRLELEDCTVQDPQLRASDGGFGLFATFGGALVARRSLLRASRNAGVMALGNITDGGEHTRVALEDCVVEDTRPGSPDRLGGVGLFASDGSLVEATRTLVQGSHSVGAYATRADGAAPSRLTLTDSVVRGTLPRASDGGLGFGATAQDGGALTALRTLFQENRTVGVLALGRSAGGSRSRVELTECVVRGTSPRQSNDSGGHGVSAQEGGWLTARRSLVVNNTSAGAYAHGDAAPEGPSLVELEGCVVGATRASPAEPDTGFGVNAFGGGRVTLARSLLRGNQSAGVHASGLGPRGRPSEVAVTGGVVQDTLPRMGRASGGFGLTAVEGARVTADLTLVRRNHGAGAFSVASSNTGLPSRIELDRCVFRDALVRAQDLSAGYGLVAQEGAVVVARRSLVAQNRGVGVGAFGTAADGTPSRVELARCIVRETLPRPSDGVLGQGAVAQFGARLTASETLFEQNRSSGVSVSLASASGEPAAVELRDCAVRDTLLVPDPDRLGIALTAVRGGRLDARRVLAARSHEGGAMASGEGTVMTLEDALVTDINPTALRGGYGVAVAGGARVEARRVTVLSGYGAALASVPSSRLAGSPRAAHLVIQDGFVRGVGFGSLGFDACNPAAPTGPPRSFGAYVGMASTLDLLRVVLLDGDVAAAAFGGTLRWTDGVASGFARDLVRSNTVVTPRMELRGVRAPNATVLEDPSLVEVHLPEPILDPTLPTPNCGRGP